MNNIYKLFIKAFSFFVLSIFFSVLLSSTLIEKIYTNSSLDNLKKISIKTIDNIKSFRDKEREDLLKVLSEASDSRITIIKDNGEVIFDSHKDPKEMVNHLDREEVKESLKKGEGSAIRFSSTLNLKMLYFAKKFNIEGQTYVFRVAKGISDIKDFVRPYRNKLTFFLSFLFLIVFVFTFLYTKNIGRKIRDLQSAIYQIEVGIFDVNINFKKNDIFYSIAECIKKLGQSIKTLTDDIKSQKELLSNILDNLPFPVVIAQKNKKILVTNKYFREIFSDVLNIDEVVNLIRDENLYKVLEFSKNEKSNFKVEVNLKDRFFSIFGNKIIHQKNELILLSFIDITEIKRTEKMKADFTANVSHELKTPITVLKGYIDTLAEEIDEERKPLIKILKKHIDRLSNLVGDVLLLSRLDAKVPLEKETFSLKEIVKNAIEPFLNEISRKNINIKIDIFDDLTYYGDSFLIFQAIINLISNAVKYTPESGTIEIKAQRDGENLILEISDTGIGIPKEYQERIFERFFVIDKSRSRQLGGTGLGLSIVKHIIELHNGKINVESEPGKGSKFTIKL